MAVQTIDLGYRRRSIFAAFHDRDQRWACMICHRRAGKTVASLMDLLDRALKKPNGRYCYIAPLRNQAKTVAWDYLTAFARPVQAKPPNQAELHVDLINGSRITLFGADGRLMQHLPILNGPIHCAWDLGNGANMAIWAFQVGEKGPLIHDFIQISGFYFDDYIKELNDRGYTGCDYLPHDARVHSFETGRTRVETLEMAGRKPRLVPKHKVDDGINAAKMTLRISKFNAERCAQGIEALRQYRQEWNEKARVFRDNAEHDWASHGADGYRYLSMAWKMIRKEVVTGPPRLFIPTGELTIADYVTYGNRRSEKQERA